MGKGGDPHRVSNKWIRENARRLVDMEIDGAEGGREGEENELDKEKNCERKKRPNGMQNTNGSQNQCQFSERWLNNFKRRFGIQTGPKDGELTLQMMEEEEEEEEEGEEKGKGQMASDLY
jgi:hypothetical protein